MYRAELIEFGSMTSGHISEQFTQKLNDYAACGYRFVQAMRVADGKYIMVFERME